MGRSAKLHEHKLAEVRAATSELRCIFFEAELPPVFPNLCDQRYKEDGPLNITTLVSRVRLAVNCCTHQPAFSDSTIRLKMLTSLAKGGRGENVDVFAMFDAAEFLGPAQPHVASDSRCPSPGLIPQPGQDRRASTGRIYSGHQQTLLTAAVGSTHAKKGAGQRPNHGMPSKSSKGPPSSSTSACNIRCMACGNCAKEGKAPRAGSRTAENRRVALVAWLVARARAYVRGRLCHRPVPAWRSSS